MHAGIGPDRLGDADIGGVCHRLHSRGDIHGLAEIVELVVERDRDRGAMMDADLEPYRALGLALVVALGGLAHGQRGSDGAGGVGVGGHHRVADRLHYRAAVGDGGLAQPVEMLLHQLEGVEIADPLVEGGRPFDVGEQDGDVADREALGTTDHLGAEQALEGLAGQQMLAGEVGVEAQETVVLLGSTLQHRDHGPARGRVRDLEPHRPRSDVASPGS